MRLLRLTRSRALALALALAVSLVVLLGGTLASAALGPGTEEQRASAVAAQAAPAEDQPANQPTEQPPLPVPTVDPDPCGSGSPSLPTCTPPSPDPTPTGTGLPVPTEVPTLPPCDPHLPLQPCAPSGTATAPPTSSTPCSGEGCIPQPGAPTEAPAAPGDSQPGAGEETEDECGITDVSACLTEGIDAFFRGIVTDALNPLLDLLSKTLLTTPMPDSLPRIGELWDNSWEILLVSYGLLVLIAGSSRWATRPSKPDTPSRNSRRVWWSGSWPARCRCG